MSDLRAQIREAVSRLDLAGTYWPERRLDDITDAVMAVLEAREAASVAAREVMMSQPLISAAEIYGMYPALLTGARTPGIDYQEVWDCDEPAPGIAFQVVREQWNNDYSIRTIHEIKLR